MSREALAGFMSALETDSTLQEELKSAVEGTGEEAAVPTERFVEIAETRGFEFTIDEALGIFELSDDELESVSGGGVFAKREFHTGPRGGARMGKVELNKPIPASLLNQRMGYKFF